MKPLCLAPLCVRVFLPDPVSVRVQPPSSNITVPLSISSVPVGGRPAPHPVEARLLGKENLAPPSRGRPTDMTMYGISDSNMSFSTRKYMEKFNLQS